MNVKMEKVEKLIQEVLDKLLQTNVIVEIPIVDKILDEINTTENLSSTSFVNIYCCWLNNALIKWKNLYPQIEIIHFALKLCSILCRNDETFLMLHLMKIPENLLSYSTSEFIWPNTLIREDYLDVLHSCQMTKYGREWLIMNISVWKHILDPKYLETSNVFLEKICCFQVDLFIKLGDTHTAFITNCLDTFISPLIRIAAIIDKVNVTLEMEEQWFREVNPVLSLLVKMCEYLFKSPKDFPYYQKALKYSKILNFENGLTKILNCVKTSSFINNIAKIKLFKYIFQISALTEENPNNIDILLDQCIEKIINLFKLNLKRGYINNILELSLLGQLYTSEKYYPNTYICNRRRKKPMILQNQFLMFQMSPIFLQTHKWLGKEMFKIIESDVIREDFMMSTSYYVHHRFYQFVYMWRNIWYNEKNTEEICMQSLKLFLKSVPLCSRDSGLIIFRRLVYCLTDIISVANTLESFDYTIMDLTLECIIKYITELDITSMETFESMNILSTALTILNSLPITLDIKAKCLRLVDLSISRSLSPSLALLVETPDSAMNFMGPLIYMNLLDKNIQIKIEAMTVLTTISKYAKIKYPYFQKILIEAELPRLTLNIVYSGNNKMLFIMALQCLQHMCVLNEVWNTFIDMNDLYKKLTDYITDEHNNEDVEVRTEMVQLIACIYEQDYFTETMKDNLYTILSSSALNEKHENVRIATLNFWRQVIKKLLNDEGIIDWEFPEMTFSKKLRKIIVYDKAEIKSVTIKIMNNLSSLGCLGVILSDLYFGGEQLYKNTKKIIDTIMHFLKTNNLTWETFYDCPAKTNNIENNLKPIDTIIKLFNENVLEIKENQRLITPTKFLITCGKIEQFRPKLSAHCNEVKLSSLFEEVLDEIMIIN